MVSIREVAKHAGVSASTVSRTLSGAAIVDPETQQRVWRAVRELNYKPNQAARSLKKGNSKLVGLIIPDITNPFYPEVVQYIEANAVKHGYALILCDALGDVEREREYFETLRYLFVDGILYLASTEQIDHVKPFIGEIPMVIINRYFDVDAPCLNIDNIDAAYQAMRYLLTNGHRELAIMVSNKERQYNQERMEGARRALADFGLSLADCTIIRDVASEEDAFHKTKVILQRSSERPTGIFLFNDFMAFGVYRGIRKSGLLIPEDISVVGFDDIPHVQYLDPPLTTIRHSIKDFANEIFANLLEQMETQTCAPHSYTTFKSKLIVRESVKNLN